MSSELRVDYEYATRITRNFSDAQDTLEAGSSSMPASVDAGDGGDFIMSIIAQLGEEAGTLAQAANLGATNMKEAVDVISGYDDEVAQTFQNMVKEMS